MRVLKPLLLPCRWWLVLAWVMVWNLSAALAQVSPTASEQIAALQLDKAARTPGQRKLDSQLIYAEKQRRGAPIALGKVKELKIDIERRTDGRVLIDMDATVTPALLAEIARVGGEVVASSPGFNQVRAALPLQQIETLATRGDVRFIRRAAKWTTNAGTVVTQGDVTHRANIVRAKTLATGRGVKVGVLSDSVDYLTNSLAQGELPSVKVLSGQSGFPASGEGTAMLELIHDLAPDAQLFFATANNGEGNFAQNILNLRAAGCDIIVDDVGYFSESPFQDGSIAQAVETVTAEGALYFSSAGNAGNKNDGTSGTWEGDFVSGGAATGPLNGKGGEVHSFGAATYNTVIYEGGGWGADLFWADPLGASDNDYDLYVLDATGANVLQSSTTAQTGTQDPYESVNSLNAGERLVIVKASGASRFLHLGTRRGILTISTNGNIAGHAAAAGAVAVAAVDVATSFPQPFRGGSTNPVESFESDGPRRVFFQANGTAITPGDFSATGGVVRQKPDLAAADGGATSVSDRFEKFFGTSAAAPHAAAIAALVKSFNPALTMPQVRAALLAGCRDIEAVGVDADSGAGLLDAVDAIAAAPAPPPPAAKPVIESDAMTLISETNINSKYDPGELVTVSFSLKNTGNAASSQLIATLLPEAGVTEPSAAQTYGALAVNGASVARQFTFRANGPQGGINRARLQLNDGVTDLGVVEFIFTLSATESTEVEISSYKTVNAVTIPGLGTGTPNPATLAVSGFHGAISNVSVKLFGFTHAHPSDVQILLVSPTGQKVVLMANAGGSVAVSNIFLGFDDISGELPYYTALTSSWSAPAQYGAVAFAAPAPAAPYANELAEFNGYSPNGTWQLFVNDGTAGGSGSIAGWSLTLKTESTAPVTKTNVFHSSSSISIPISGKATPYPSTLSLAGYTGTITKVTATLSGFNHSYPDDVQVLLVNANTGQRVLLMGHNGGTFGVGGLTLTFDDAAAQYLPSSTVLSSGTWAPNANASTELPSPAPTGLGSYNYLLSAFNGTNPNSAWQLYVNDLGTPDGGAIPNWSLAITTFDGAPITKSTADLSVNFVASTTALPATNYTIKSSIVNHGPSACTNAVAKYTVPADVTYVSATASQGSVSFANGVVTANLGNMAIGASATFSVTILPGDVEYFANNVDITASEPDPDRSNNHDEAYVLVGTVDLVPYHHPDYSDTIILYTDTVDDASTFTTSDAVYVYPVVLNQGNASAAGGIKIELYLDNVLFDSRTRAAKLNGNYLYAPGFSVGPLAAGTHTLRMKIDPANSIAETNEGNNEYTRTITVTGTDLADLKPLDYTLYGYSDKFLFYTDTASDVTTFSSTDVVTVYSAIINQGALTSPATFATEFYLDGVLNSTKTCLQPLSVGNQFNIPSFKIGPLTAGTHTLRIKVDSGNAATEIDELNNDYTRTFTVTAATANTGSLAIAPAALPDATKGSLYHQIAKITGGTKPYKSLTITNFIAGTTGLTSADVVTDAANGTVRVSVSPMSVGLASFIVTVTDNVNAVLSKSYTLRVGLAESVWAESRLMAWGSNGSGEAGDNSTVQREVPIAVTSSGVIANKTVVAMATGVSHCLALCSDGTLASWGNNTHGELGDGTLIDSSVPIPVLTTGTALAGKTVVAIAAGGYHNLVLCSDGTLITWGLNYYGQLGNATATDSSVAVFVHATGTDLDGKKVALLTAGTYHSLVLCTDGTLVAWGYNLYGQLGDDTTTTVAPYGSMVPVTVKSAGTAISGKTIIALAAGERHSMVLCSDSSIATWGRNRNGQLGDDTTDDRKKPVTVTTVGTPLAGKSITSISAGAFHSLALCSDGTMASWGRNAEGQLGIGSISTTDPFGVTLPVAITTAGTPLAGKTVVSLIAGSYHNLALASDGTLAAWGDNDFGQLGTGTTTASYLPVLVDGTALQSAEKFVQVSSGGMATHNLSLVASSVSSTVTTLAATDITTTSATLHGTVNANGTFVSTLFEHGTSTSYGAVISGSPSTVNGNTTTDISAAITGLSPGTLYHFKLKAGSTSATDVTFTTVSTNAKLVGFAVSVGSFSPGFVSTTASYSLTVPYASSSITVTPTAQQANATVTVNGTSVSSGTASAPLSLNVGSNSIAIEVTAQDGVSTESYTLNVTRTQPRIQIEVDSVALVDNDPTPFDMGRTLFGSKHPVTFTIRNVGDQTLSLGTFTKSSTTGQAGQFILGSPMASNLSIGGSTQFTVQFVPTVAGVANMTVQVPSNDADTPTFDLNLSGTGVSTAPGSVQFDRVLFTTTESSGTLNVPVVRTGGDYGVISVTIATGGGTATANADYTKLSQVLTFADGEVSKLVPVSILTGNAVNEADETFTLSLSKPIGGAKLGLQKTTNVRIVDVDTGGVTTPSLPIIATPSSNAVLPLMAGATTLVTGTAKDNKGIASVEVQLGSGAFEPATLSKVIGTGASYSLAVTPLGGLNTINVRSIDTSGNVSPVTTRSFSVSRPLSVLLSGPGSVSNGFAPSSFREIGKTYSITATAKTTPAPGYVFGGWSISGGPTQAEIGVDATALLGATLSFIYREGLVLTANFASTPFAAVAGSYNGLVSADAVSPTPSGTPPSHHSEGFFNATVQSRGNFTGKLKIGGLMLPITGVFDASGTARFGPDYATRSTLLRKGLPSLEVSLQLDLSTPAVHDDDRISGTVIERTLGVVSAQSNLEAQRAYYDGKTASTNVPDAYLTVSGTANSIKKDGVFTVILPAKGLGSQPAGFTLADYPQGTGYATMKVTKAGQGTLSGKLADGTALNSSAPLTRNGPAIGWPLYAELYAKKGSLSGPVLFEAQTHSDFSATDLRWFRPYQDTQHYRDGWPEGVILDLLGAKYAAAPAQSVLPNVIDPARQATLTLADGLISGSILREVRLSTADGVTLLSTTGGRYSLSLTRSSGLFKGTFTHTNGKLLNYFGAVYQKGSTSEVGGFGFFLTELPKVKNYTGQSGSVLLRAQ